MTDVGFSVELNKNMAALVNRRKKPRERFVFVMLSFGWGAYRWDYRTGDLGELVAYVRGWESRHISELKEEVADIIREEEREGD